MLLGAFTYKVCMDMISFLLDIGVELLSHMVILCLTISEGSLLLHFGVEGGSRQTLGSGEGGTPW